MSDLIQTKDKWRQGFADLYELMEKNQDSLSIKIVNFQETANDYRLTLMEESGLRTVQVHGGDRFRVTFPTMLYGFTFQFHTRQVVPTLKSSGMYVAALNSEGKVLKNFLSNVYDKQYPAYDRRMVVCSWTHGSAPAWGEGIYLKEVEPNNFFGAILKYVDGLWNAPFRYDSAPLDPAIIEEVQKQTGVDLAQTKRMGYAGYNAKGLALLEVAGQRDLNWDAFPEAPSTDTFNKVFKEKSGKLMHSSTIIRNRLKAKKQATTNV